MIKMIVTDLDETLLHTDKSVSLYTKEILTQVRNKGIKTVFATARGGSSEQLVPYELFDSHVLFNGAKAYTEETLIYERTITPEVMIPILLKLDKLKLETSAEVEGKHYVNFDIQKKWGYINDFILTDFTNIKNNANKISVLVEDSKQVEKIKEIIPENLYLNVSKDNLAMIMHKEATKIKAISAVAAHFGIANKDIMVFGDDVNDIEMLKGCGVGVAMGNALQSVKNVSDYICDTNDNDGVAKWLEEELL